MLSQTKPTGSPGNEKSFGFTSKMWKKIFGSRKKSKTRIVLVKKTKYTPEISVDPADWRRYCVIGLIVLSVLSFLFEWRRLYLEEVAKKTSTAMAGMPASCMGSVFSWSGIKSILTFQFSWSQDPCEKYHHAVLVDAFWEVSPIVVATSLIARTIVKPMEILTSGISKSTRNLFSEIPAQWQPVFFLVFVLIMVIAVMGYFGYSIKIPFVVSIESNRPVQQVPSKQQKQEISGKKYQ